MTTDTTIITTATSWTTADILEELERLLSDVSITEGDHDDYVRADCGARSLTIYWDESDPAEPGWAWRTRDASGDVGDDDAGPLDYAAELVALAQWLARG